MEVFGVITMVGVIIYLATTHNPDGSGRSSKPIKVEAPEITVTNVISFIEVVAVAFITLWVVI